MPSWDLNKTSQVLLVGDVGLVDCCSCPYVVIDFPGINCPGGCCSAAASVVAGVQGRLWKVPQMEAVVVYLVKLPTTSFLNTCRNRSGGRTCDPA